MSQLQTFSRVWYWSKSCKLSSSVTTEVMMRSPIAVTDSEHGEGAHSVQLNLANADGRAMQNMVQIYTRGGLAVVWSMFLSDEKGTVSRLPEANQVFNMQRVDIPRNFNPLGLGGYVLSFVKSVEAITGLLILFGVNPATRVPYVAAQYSKPLAARYLADMRVADVEIVGAGGSSFATFRSGAFDISLKMQDAQGLPLDVTFDGINFAKERFMVPTPCGKAVSQTLENSNLLTEIYGVWNGQVLGRARI